MKGQKGSETSSQSGENHQLAILGHELGNVLNGLMGMAELLGDSRLDAEQRKWLNAIEYSGRQIHSLIRTACHVSADESCGSERVDGIRLLEQIATSHTPSAQAGGCRLYLVVAPELPRYWLCDPCAVRQLLDNLVGNALKFTGAGDVVVEASAGAGERGGPRELTLRVRDTGPGIGPEEVKRIFSPYWQKSPGSNARPGNRGLGLYICREIVRSLQGQISCASPTECGAEFTVRLPGILPPGIDCPPVLQHSLFARINCRLRLAQPLASSVENILERLGIRHGVDGGQTGETVSGSLELLISEASPEVAGSVAVLQVAVLSETGESLAGRSLQAPVVQSSLGLVLLQLALECRSREIRSEKRG